LFETKVATYRLSMWYFHVFITIYSIGLSPLIFFFLP
jgi:hypothetical protein